MSDWQGLAEMLLDAVGDQVADSGHPAWVRVFDPPAGDQEDGFALAMCAEPDALMGWVATSDCQAVGVIATGRLRALEDALPGSVGYDDEGRIRMACLVTRSGETAWTMVAPDGVKANEPPSAGRMLDCLRRCFGLPTPPPPASPARLQVVAWLASVLEKAQDAPRPLTWSEVATLHPVARILGGEMGSSHSELLPGLVRIAGAAWSWDELRRRAHQDHCLADVIDPKLAGWMDEGMFARWVLADVPSPDEILAAVRPLLSPSAARRLAHAVHAASSSEPACQAG